MSHAFPSDRIVPRNAWWLTGAAFLLLAATLAVVAFSAVRGGDGEPPAPDALKGVHDKGPKPEGVITYSVTGKGFFAVTAAGLPLGPVSEEEALHIHDAAAQDRVLSPDGTRSARIERTDAGVFLAVGAPGAEEVVTQLAGPSDPELVSGGKGHAREVAGVPLVVAWSPDSKLLAFGSITGEPWSLQIYDTRLGMPAVIRNFAVRGGYVGELAWASTGEHLAISTYSLDRRNHSVLMLDMATAQVRYLVDGCHLTWSPDGAFLAVHRDPGPEGGAWVVSPAGETLYAISREEQAFPYAWVA